MSAPGDGIAAASAAPARRAQPVLAGVITALVGFFGSFPIVLAGLVAVGASPAQAGSGLLAATVIAGVAGIGLSATLRMPVSIAWTTPRAALLIGTGAVSGGYAAAIGAFLLSGVLLALCGLSTRLGRAIAAIPAPIAAAILAGVLLPLCLEPARGVVAAPELAGPVVLTWLVLLRVARRWAVVGMLATTLVVVLVAGGDVAGGGLAPHPVLTAPAFDVGTLIGLGVPLFVVTMASQNIPGMAVLSSFGYRPPLRPILLSTGGLTALGAPVGVAAVNLAAITAALAAGPEAGRDPSRRWIAGVAAGVVYVVLGLGAGVATAVVAAAPDGVVETAVGLALFGPFTNAVAAATREEGSREAAAVTLLVAASGIAVLGISAPFWGLLAGLALLAVGRAGRERAAAATDD